MRARLMETLEAVQPYSQRRAAHRELALYLARSLPDIARRETLPAHLTASTFLVDSAHASVLLVRHPKFHRWLQPGGHCDGDDDLAAVANRELIEETGIRAAFASAPFDVDVHPGEPGGAPHVHVDVRFVAAAAPGASASEPSSPEGLELRWFAAEEIEEDWVREAAEIAIADARKWAILDSNQGPPPYQSGALTD